MDFDYLVINVTVFTNHSAHNLHIALRGLEGTVNETINWLNASQEASKEEYEEKRADLDTIAKYVCFFISFYLFFESSLFQPYYCWRYTYYQGVTFTIT